MQFPRGNEMSKEGRQNGGLALMTCSGSESEDSGDGLAALEVSKADFLQGEVRDGPKKGGGVVDQMEFEDSGGAVCPV